VVDVLGAVGAFLGYQPRDRVGAEVRVAGARVADASGRLETTTRMVATAREAVVTVAAGAVLVTALGGAVDPPFVPALVVLAMVAVFVFLMLHMSPGDPAVIIAGDYATTAQIERIRESLGLHEPLHVQFFTWLGNLMRGDLGHSIYSGLPVTELIGQRRKFARRIKLIGFAVGHGHPVRRNRSAPLCVRRPWRVRVELLYRCRTQAVRPSRPDP
jgi:hypothetical protein